MITEPMAKCFNEAYRTLKPGADTVELNTKALCGTVFRQFTEAGLLWQMYQP